ncbi:MAG: hypothetical protein RL653_3388, partial [Pseudomonadota bacterium]
MAARSRKKSDTEGAAEAAEAPKKKAPARKKGTPKGKASAKKKAPARARKALVEVEAAAEGDGTPRPARAYSLVVVESPAKAKTIKKYLGPGYTVQASRGHVKDLPTSKLGVDVENGFEPAYVVAKGKEDVLSDLKKAARGAQSVFLATDPDREGEA